MNEQDRKTAESILKGHKNDKVTALILIGLACLCAYAAWDEGEWDATTFAAGTLVAAGIAFWFESVIIYSRRSRQLMAEGCPIRWKTPVGVIKRGKIREREWIEGMGEYRFTVEEHPTNYTWTVWAHEIV